jgi:hypothetical protein
LTCINAKFAGAGPFIKIDIKIVLPAEMPKSAISANALGGRLRGDSLNLGAVYNKHQTSLGAVCNKH